MKHLNFDRVSFLKSAERRAAVKRPRNKRPNLTKAFFEIYRDCPLAERQARALAYALLHETVNVKNGNALVGQYYLEYCCDLGGSDFDPRWQEFDCNHVAEARARREIDGLAQLTGQTVNGRNVSWVTYASCAPAHIGWRYDWIMASGVNGLLKRIKSAEKTADDTGEKFLNGCRIMLDAMLEWSDRHAGKLQKALASAKDPVQKKLLRQKLRVVRRVPRHGARNFHEALQSFYFSYLVTMFENPYGGNGPGRLDYFLWPYLERDLKSGVETPDSARQKIDELFIRLYERNYCRDMGIETIVVAGSHPDGKSAFHLLSEIMVHSIIDLGIQTPHVYIRMPSDPPPELISLAVDYLLNGHNMAQILSDPAVVGAMTKDGHMPETDARMYMCGGCMELSPQGMNCDLLFTGFFNVPKILELVINGGRCLNTGQKILPHLTKTLADYPDFESLFAAFAAELERTLSYTFRCMDIFSEEAARLRPAYLLSAQIADCIERARNLNDNGARYQDYGSAPIGIPDVSDSLNAINLAVFEQKWLDAPTLLDALGNNFAHAELLRLRLSALPKYGQGDRQADRMADRVLKLVCSVYDSARNRFGGRIKPMIMSFVFSPVAGNALGATAAGQLAGQPVAQGLTPHSRSMTRGITTAILSANSLDLTQVSGGVTSMWDVDRQIAVKPVMQSLLQSFIATGGQIFQGNTTSVEELQAAVKNPDAFPHLIVRVGGFSAKFTALSCELQDEIIHRLRHRA